MTRPEKTNALSFLTTHSVGVLATLSPDGAPRARTLYYAADESFAIYFSTLTGTRKVDDIAHNTKAAFVVSDETAPQTIQVEGILEDLTETATINDVIKRLLGTFMEHGAHFAPLAHLDAGQVRFYKLTPTWVRFGDFTGGFGSENSFLELPL